MYFKCCIANCTSKREDTNLHKFPSDENQRKKWLDCINCDSLKCLDSGKLLKLLVCHKHFEMKFHTIKSGIKKTAYPTLFSAEEMETGISSRSYDDKNIDPVDHTYACKRHYDHSYSKDKEPLFDPTMMPSTSSMTHFKQLDIVADAVVASTSSCDTSNQIVSATDILMSTPKKMGRKRIIQKTENMTPKCKLLYGEYKKSRRQLNYNVRAKRAQTFSKEHNFEKLTKNMNSLAKEFIWMQINMCSKNKKGRRFSLEEKLMSLSIYKQSPKAYRFLQKMFILPSNTILKKMIAGLDIKAGINTQVFTAIKEEVSNWGENKKICTIMFDEMALEPSLVYSHKNDYIHGFVELNEKKKKTG